MNNIDFNLDELVEAIQLSHDSATGPDEITIKCLNISQRILLKPF